MTGYEIVKDLFGMLWQPVTVIGASILVVILMFLDMLFNKERVVYKRIFKFKVFSGMKKRIESRDISLKKGKKKNHNS